ncbi:MAG: hypothetical protein IT317_06635 [Anaerolineales bacterium]|nr:hypothetical protein [Anaerolineales bacterium]
MFGLLPRFRFTGLVAVTAGLGALGALLLLTLSLPARATLSAWAPSSLFALGLVLQADALSWVFGMAVVVITLAAVVTGLGRPGGQRVGTRAAMLLLALASLMSIFSENLLTRVIAWALLDLIYFVTLLFLGEGENVESQAVLTLAINSTGTLLALAAAVMISRTSPSLSLRDAALTPQSTLLITLAGVFRLGLFPLHAALPSDVDIRHGLGALARLLPVVVALETISRLALFGIVPTLRPWLTLFAVAAAVIGALQLWSVPDPRRGVAYLIISQSGVALLAGLWGGPQGALALTAIGLSLGLGAALIFLGSGHDEMQPWPTMLPLIGGAAMAGAPLTVGFLGVAHLYGSLALAGGWAWLVLIAVAVAQVVFIGGLLYTIFWPGLPAEGEPAVIAVHYGGLSLPAILLIMLAFFAPVLASALSAPGVGALGFAGPTSVAGLVFVLLTTTGGVALWRFDAALRDRFGRLAGLPLVSLGRLDWLYRFAWSGIRGAGAVAEALGSVLEGEGAILWALVAGVLVWLLWKG